MSSTGLQAAWQTRGPLAIVLWPISLVYSVLMRLRSLAYAVVQGRGHATGHAQGGSGSSVPVIVVGNLSVGGTGKTPLCSWLVRHFVSLGYRPGIVSRGHGGQPHEKPHLIDAAIDTASRVGDEPLMLALDTGVPVCVCINRAAAVAHLQENTAVDVVFSDDGLQHLKMRRTAELVVIDVARGLGNGWVLPAGPLREPVSRIASVDAVVLNGKPASEVADIPGLPQRLAHGDVPHGSFMLGLTSPRSLIGQEPLPLSSFKGQRVHAVAGIGHPQRFFDSLRQAGMEVVPHPMPDHHAYTAEDVTFDDALPVMVTSKDAVKLRQLAQVSQSVFEVPVELLPDQSLLDVVELLRDKCPVREG